MYGDDVIFLNINSPNDSVVLEVDNDSLLPSCDINNLLVNVGKCKHMVF